MLVPVSPKYMLDRVKAMMQERANNKEIRKIDLDSALPEEEDDSMYGSEKEAKGLQHSPSSAEKTITGGQLQIIHTKLEEQI